MIVILIPAYRCEHTIGKVVLKARKYGVVIICDDGSDDFTAEIATCCQAEVIKNPRNLGKGEALKNLFNYVRGRDPDIVVTMDADDQHDADEIPELIKPIIEGRADVVSGTRQKKSWFRAIGGKFLNLFSPHKELDYQCGFRAYSHKALKAIEVKESGFFADQQILEDLMKKGVRVTQVPITTRYDKYSHSKNPISHFLEVLESITYRKPLITFGVFGLIASLIGLSLLYNVALVWFKYAQLGIGRLMLGAVMILLGSFSFFAGLILHVLIRKLGLDGKAKKIMNVNNDAEMIK